MFKCKKLMSLVLAGVTLFSVEGFAMDERPKEPAVPHIKPSGKLFLEAELTQEQKKAIVKKYIEPYEPGVKKMGGFTLASWDQWTPVTCLKLEPLEKMVYRTEFAYNIGKEEAEVIIDYLKSSLTEVSTAPYINTVEPSYDEVATKPSPRRPEDPNERYQEIHFNLTSHPEGLALLRDKIVSEQSDLKDSICTFGSIAFAKTGIYENLDEITPVEYDPNYFILRTTPKILNEFKSKDPLELSFNTFTLKYINEQGKVSINESLNLPQTQDFDVRYPLNLREAQ